MNAMETPQKVDAQNGNETECWRGVLAVAMGILAIVTAAVHGILPEGPLSTFFACATTGLVPLALIPAITAFLMPEERRDLVHLGLLLNGVLMGLICIYFRSG